MISVLCSFLGGGEGTRLRESRSLALAPDGLPVPTRSVPLAPPSRPWELVPETPYE